MSDLHDRFDRLARRGTTRGIDAVFDDARREADAGGGLAGVPVNLELTPERRTRRRFGALIATGGVAASLFVGALAIGAFVGSGGGSNSPAGAVQQLADAVAHEDPLAAADVLAPEEVRSLHGTVDAATKKAQELSVVSTASAPLAGLDLSVDNLKLSTTSLGDGYAKVTIDDGTISARTDKPKFSALVQRALGDTKDNSASADLAKLARSSGLPTFVVTVQQDGHWYVSAAYTTLEYIREVNHLPAADFGSGLQAAATLGAESPDAAVSDAVHALAKGDWQKLIALAPPDEIPVYDYRGAILQLAKDSNPNFTVDALTTTATVSGDTAKVKLKASGSTSAGDKWSVDGSCFTGADSSMTFSVTGSDGSSQGIDSSSSTTTGAPSTACGFQGLYLFGGDAPDSGSASDGITVVKENGRWFVSPVGTVLDLLDQAIVAVNQREVYTLLNLPDLLPPDGTLTLGKPVTLAAGTLNVRVYTFAGKQGERLLGLSTTSAQNSFDGISSVGVRVFDPAGKELTEAYQMLDGQALQLPVDGTYKVVIQPYFNTDATVTIWDEAQAPEAAKHSRFPSAFKSCTRSSTGVQTCTPSTIPPGLTDDGSNGSNFPPETKSSSSTSVPGA